MYEIRDCFHEGEGLNPSSHLCKTLVVMKNRNSMPYTLSLLCILTQSFSINFTWYNVHTLTHTSWALRCLSVQRRSRMTMRSKRTSWDTVPIRHVKGVCTEGLDRSLLSRWVWSTAVLCTCCCCVQSIKLTLVRMSIQILPLITVFPW